MVMLPTIEFLTVPLSESSVRLFNPTGITRDGAYHPHGHPNVSAGVKGIWGVVFI